MSTTIDSKVVEMRFDNKHFESNVSTTMSTLDKLKQKLNLSGASKGLEDVGSAAKKIDMSNLGRGIETVHAKFSALEVMGVTALANITNSAVNAGKRIMSALTIDPVKTGFSEYETQINAVQTILANTSSKGTTIDDVNKALEELNKYADMTIYNFTEMTRNIGTFTAAGIDLDTSVNAIQGIANLAAVSGSTSQQASTAMYQLSQALASGTVKLMDWNSVVNAGMGGEVFQNALKETSKLLGTGAEAAIEAEGSFRESLKSGWLTAEVLTETLKKFTSSGANEYVAKYTGLSVDAVEATLQSAEAKYGEADAIKYASEALAQKSGKNAKEISEMLTFAKTATDAATKVKTFTQLWDVLKESAQSGWSQTWKLLVGDFEQAKSLLTPPADFLTGFIGKMSDFRNNILESALGKNFRGMADILSSALDPIKSTADAVEGVADSLKDYATIVDEIINGNWGNGEKRWQALTDAGYDWAHAQNLVNEKLGSSVRHTTNYTEAQKKNAKATGELTEADAKNIEALTKLSDEQLRSKGLTNEQIEALRDLETVSDKLGIPISELIGLLDELDGRWLLINSFKNIGRGLVSAFKAIGDAWKEIFTGFNEKNLAAGLFNALGAFHKFSVQMKENIGDGEKIKRTFKGVFAILDIVLTLVGGPLKIAFKVLTEVLGIFDLSIWDITAVIGDAIVKFRDWIDKTLDFTSAFKKIVNPIKNAIKTFRNWIESLKESENLPLDIAKGIASGFGKAVDAVKNFFKNFGSNISNGFSALGDSPLGGFINGLRKGVKVVGQVFVELGKMALNKLNEFLSARGMKEISLDTIKGFINGIQDGLGKVAVKMVEFGKTIINKAKEVLGIHSPSTVFFAIGGFIVAGLLGGLLSRFPKVQEFFQNLGTNISGFIGDIDWGGLFSAGLMTGFLVVLNKMADGLSVFMGLGDMFEEIGDAVKEVGKSIKQFGKAAKLWALSKVITSVAIAIGVLAASVFLLSLVDPGKLWGAVGAMAALMVLMGGLVVVLSKFGPKEASDMGKYALALLGLGAAMLLIAIAVKTIGNIESMDKAIAGMISLMVLIAGLMYSTQWAGDTVDKVGGTILKIGAAMLLMVIVAKIAAGMSEDEMIRGGLALVAFAGIIVGLIAATKLINGSKNVDAIGKTLRSIATAMLLMVIVAKIAGNMSTEEMIRGGIALVAFAGIMVGLMAATKLISGSKNVDAIGKTLLKIAGAMLLMVIVAKIAGGMSNEEMIRAGIALTAFAGIMVGLMAATKLVTGSKNVDKIGKTLLQMAVAIGIMGLVVALLGFLSVEHLAKGVIAVGLLGTVMALMLVATKNAQDCKGNLIVMTVAIGVMAAAIAALSFIDTTKLAVATGALALVMGMFALIVKAGSNIQSSLGVLIVMTVAIGVMAGAIYLLAGLPIQNTIASAISLSTLMLALAAAFAVVGIVGKIAGNQGVLYGLIGLAGIIVALYAVVGALALMQNVQNATENAKALGALLIVMSVATAIISVVGLLVAATGGMALLGLAGLLGIIVAIYAIVGALAIMQNIQNAETNINLLTGLLTTMTGILVVLAIVGPLALIGVSALTALSGLMLAFGVLAVAIGALMEYCPQLQEFLNTGIPVMVQLAGGLGQMIGAFIAGIATEVMATLPMLGMCLSQFMTNAMPFIVGAKMVDGSVLAGVGILAGAVIALTAADLIAGVASFLQGGSSFAALGTELSMFMMNAMPFITMAAMITPEMLSGVKALAETILILTAANVIEGLTSWFTGGSSLENFAAQLPILGAGLAAFATSLGAFTDEQLATVNSAAEAVKKLASAANEIPNTGGLLASIVGDNDLGTFAAQFPVLGTGIRDFLNNIGTFTDEQVATVNCAADAVKTLAEVAQSIPNTGGWLGQIVGDNDLGNFAAQFPVLGMGIRMFLDSIGTFSDAETSTVEAAASAVKSLAEVSQSIPNTGGWLGQIVGDNDLGSFAAQFPIVGSGIRGFLENIGTFSDAEIATLNAGANAVKTLAEVAQSVPNTGGLLAAIVGDNDLGNFASKFPTVGSGIRGFADELGSFSDGQVAAVSSGCDAIRAITTLANADLDGAIKSLSGFSDKLPGFGEDIASFCRNMPTSTALQTATKNLDILLDATKNIANANSGALATFAENLQKVGKEAVRKFIEAFTTAKPDLNKDAKELAQEVVDGIESKEKRIKRAATNAAEEAIDGFNSQTDDAESAGKDLGSGLVKGIQAKETAVYNAGYALGQKAVQGEKDGQASNSPSKLTIQAGKWLGEGLVIGMGKMGNQVYKAGSTLGETATDTISSTISRIADTVNTDIDSQPTIRPVLDLSDVQSGVGTLNGMLNMNSSIGVRANIGAISSMMNNRNQNGSNADVVSAINKLGSKMNNLGNTYNSVNGVTYDDGSNTSNAVADLVRAIRIERRV